MRIKDRDMVFVKTHDISELNQELIGKQVVLGGWVEDLRKLGKMSFITLRDVYRNFTSNSQRGIK